MYFHVLYSMYNNVLVYFHYIYLSERSKTPDEKGHTFLSTAIVFPEITSKSESNLT